VVQQSIAIREYGWSMRITKLPAAKLASSALSFRLFSLLSRRRTFLLLFSFLFFTGSVIVIADFAREISTFCFCSTCNNSACSVPRGSSAGSTISHRPFRPGFFAPTASPLK